MTCPTGLCNPFGGTTPDCGDCHPDQDTDGTAWVDEALARLE